MVGNSVGQDTLFLYLAPQNGCVINIQEQRNELTKRINDNSKRGYTLVGYPALFRIENLTIFREQLREYSRKKIHIFIPGNIAISVLLMMPSIYLQKLIKTHTRTSHPSPVPGYKVITFFCQFFFFFFFNTSSI